MDLMLNSFHWDFILRLTGHDFSIINPCSNLKPESYPYNFN